MTDLASFLKEQQTGLFESSGAFTINADKALAKLAHSQLPDPSYWILKVAQFAAAFGVEEVTITLDRRVTRVSAALPRPLSISDLRSGLDSVAPLKDRALDHLVTGLRAIGGTAERRFALRLAGLESSEYLLFDGEKLSTERKDDPCPLIAMVLEVTSARAAWKDLVDAVSLQRRADEGSTLSERAFTVPYALTVDGRKLGYNHLAKPICFTQQLYWDFAPYEDGMMLPHFLLPSPEARGSAFWQVSYNYTLHHKILRFSAEPVDLQMPSTLHWLKDGVVVRTERLTGPATPFSVNLYVDATDCPADLGGLNLRQTPEFLAKREWLEELAVHMDQTVRERIMGLDKLPGTSLGGWDALLTTTSHLPMSSSLRYDKPRMVSSKLNAHPAFRKKLLRHLHTKANNRKIGFDELKPARL